jgi:hypothetical protein
MVASLSSIASTLLCVIGASIGKQPGFSNEL